MRVSFPVSHVPQSPAAIFSLLRCPPSLSLRPLIYELSPKKTWEGFLGAFASTMVFAWLLSGFMAQFAYFRCPVSVRCFVLSLLLLSPPFSPLCVCGVRFLLSIPPHSLSSPSFSSYPLCFFFPPLGALPHAGDFSLPVFLPSLHKCAL